MKQDDNVLLEAFIATSGYTIRALEEAIVELKQTIRKSGNRDLIPIFQERLEQLENHLAVVTYVNQEQI